MRIIWNLYKNREPAKSSSNKIISNKNKEKQKEEGKDFENAESQAGDGTSPEEVSKDAANIKIINNMESFV